MSSQGVTVVFFFGVDIDGVLIDENEYYYGLLRSLGVEIGSSRAFVEVRRRCGSEHDTFNYFGEDVILAISNIENYPEPSQSCVRTKFIDQLYLMIEKLEVINDSYRLVIVTDGKFERQRQKYIFLCGLYPWFHKFDVIYTSKLGLTKASLRLSEYLPDTTTGVYFGDRFVDHLFAKNNGIKFGVVDW